MLKQLTKCEGLPAGLVQINQPSTDSRRQQIASTVFVKLHHGNSEELDQLPFRYRRFLRSPSKTDSFHPSMVCDHN